MKTYQTIVKYHGYSTGINKHIKQLLSHEVAAPTVQSEIEIDRKARELTFWVLIANIKNLDHCKQYAAACVKSKQIQPMIDDLCTAQGQTPNTAGTGEMETRGRTTRRQ